MNLVVRKPTSLIIAFPHTPHNQVRNKLKNDHELSVGTGRTDVSFRVLFAQTNHLLIN